MQFLDHVREAEDPCLDVALLNRLASIRPRSSAGTISPPGSGLTAGPMWANTSTARLSRHRAELQGLEVLGDSPIGFLDQLSGCAGIGTKWYYTTFDVQDPCRSRRATPCRRRSSAKERTLVGVHAERRAGTPRATAGFLPYQ